MAASTQRILLGHVKGDQGDPGVTATVEVGTTTTGNPGTSAGVTVAAASTATNTILDFIIPRGDEGPSGSSTASHPMPASNDLHDWVTPGAEGLYFGEGTGLTNAPDAGRWKYLGIATDEPAGDITLLAFSDDDRQMQKTCIAGTWGDWVEGGTAPKLIPAVAGTNLDTYRTPGFYYQPVTTAANAELVQNQPISNPIAVTAAQTRMNTAFALLVERHAGIVQTYIAYSAAVGLAPRTFRRATLTPISTWGNWAEMLTRGAPATPTNASGILPAVTNTMPMMARMTPRFASLVGSDDITIVGAMSLQSFDNNRTYFFLGGDDTNAMMRGASRTVYDPRMVASDFTFVTIPIMFNQVGYVGCWGQTISGFYDFDYGGDAPYRVSYDFHGFAFTQDRRALWIRYMRPGAQTIEISMVNLNGLPAAGWVTAMWATATDIYLICNNQLYRAELWRHMPEVQPNPDYKQFDRITGSPTFTLVTDPALPVINLTTRIFCERIYLGTNPPGFRDHTRVLVWGNGAPANRLALFTGVEWKALTLPFNVAATNTSNLVVMFTNGRIGAFNPTNGYYYTCDNPLADTPLWVHRYTVAVATNHPYMVTRGISPGFPSFLPRNQRWYPWVTEIYPDRHTTDSGVWISNGGVGLQYYKGTRPLTDHTYFPVPNELYYSNRLDIIPAGWSMGRQGYAYPVGTRIGRASIQADHTSYTAITTMSGWFLGMPPMVASTGLPIGFIQGSTAAFEMRDEANRRIYVFGVRNTMT